VSTSSAADVDSVQTEIKRAVFAADVSSQADLASEVTGSLKSIVKLAHDLGRRLTVLVLIAAFAVAILLGRRVLPSASPARAITWSRGFTVADLDFSASSQTGYSSSAQLQYYFAKTGEACGSNDVPGKAQEVLIQS
jgi:hypothetical protein